MDFTLTESQRACVDSAGAFADLALKPHAARWDREHEFPVATIKEAAALGFCGLYTPEQYGGLALPRLDASLVFERLAMGCTSTTAYLTIHNMVSWMLGTWLPCRFSERASADKPGTAGQHPCARRTRKLDTNRDAGFSHRFRLCPAHQCVDTGLGALSASGL